MEAGGTTLASIPSHAAHPYQAPLIGSGPPATPSHSNLLPALSPDTKNTPGGPQSSIPATGAHPPYLSTPHIKGAGTSGAVSGLTPADTARAQNPMPGRQTPVPPHQPHSHTHQHPQAHHATPQYGMHPPGSLLHPHATPPPHPHATPPQPQSQLHGGYPPHQLSTPHGRGNGHPGGNVFQSVMGSAPGHVPQDDVGGAGQVKVYASAYSQVPVFEAMIRNISVMRRMSDNWVNATQILKVAGITKSVRTKILEKQVQQQQHEKIQGGYGKYQGTWVPLEYGRSLAEQYGVLQFLTPIFDFVPPPTGPPALPMRSGTPTAQKTPVALAHSNSSSGQVIQSFSQLQPPPPPQFVVPDGQGQQQQMMVPPPPQMMYPPGGQMFYQPPPPPGFHESPHSLEMAPELSHQHHHAPAPHLVHPHGLAPPVNINGHGLPAPADMYIDPYGQPQVFHHPVPYADAEGAPSSKRVKMEDAEIVTEMREVEEAKDESEREQKAGKYDEDEEEEDDDEFQNGNVLPTSFRLASKPFRPKLNAASNRRRQLWLSLFAKDGPVDVRSTFELGPGELPEWDIDTIIDEFGNTPLHWACAMAKMDVTAQLIELGADIHRGNYRGETPLIRSVLARNHAEAGTFQSLLESHLGESVRTLDHAHQSVVHHIAYMAGLAGRAAAARTYMATVLEWVAKEQQHQQQVMQQQASEAGLVPQPPGSSANAPASTGSAHAGVSMASSVNAAGGGGLNLKRLVDVQDVHGDTALNIAARVGSKPLVKLLLEAGADKAKANKLDLKPVDFGIEVEALAVSGKETAVSNLKSEVRKPEKRSADILRNIGALFEDLNKTFDAEMERHVEQLGEVEKSVRVATSSLAERRQQVQQAHLRVEKFDRLSQRAENVRRAVIAAECATYPLAFTGRGTTTSDGNQTPTAFRSLPGVQEANGEIQNGDDNEDEDIPLPPVSEDEASKMATIARLRRIAAWEDRIATVLEDRIAALEGESADKAVKYRRVISLCAKVPTDKVDSMLDGLTTAVESDGRSIDLSRIAGLISRVREVEG